MKKLYEFCLIILCIFAFSIRVKADDRITTTFSNSITSSYGGTITKNTITIYSKQYNSTGRAFCTRFWYSPPSGTCNATKWNSDTTKNQKIAVAIGAMINKARSITNSGKTINEEAYFYGEMAINYFLYNYNGKSSVNNVTSLSGWSNVTANKTYQAIYAAGKEAYDNYAKTSVEFTKQKISISEDGRTINGSATLTCYNAKGVAIACSANVKQTLKLVGKSSTTFDEATNLANLDVTIDAKYSRINSPNIHYDYTYTYTLPTGKYVAVDNAVTGTFSTQNKVKYVVAQNYNCGSNYQSLTPNALNDLTLIDRTSKTASATRNVQKDCSIIVNKVDKNDAVLKGAKFNLYDNENCNGNAIDSGTSSSSGIVSFSGLSAGTYCIKETKAPNGYDIDTISKTITLNESSANHCTESKSLKFTNTKQTGKLKVLKVDENGDPVIGAKIRIFTISNNPRQFENASDLLDDMDDYDFVNDSTYDFNFIEDPITKNDYFITSTNPIQISNLIIGETYYVYEESVPENSDYSIKKGSDFVEITGTEEVTITLENVHSNFKISKQDITNKKELPGAEIQILDARGIAIEKWTSTSTPKEIKGLEDGEYTLVEITAPKGYKKAESINFTIKDGKLKDDNDNILVMYDAVEKVEIIKVPDTLNARNILIFIAAIAVVGAGIGIFLYGVKRKNQI